MSSGDLISRIYSGFRGVDFRGDEINLVRSPDSLNVWKDYKEIDSIRTRPGTQPFSAFAEKVYGIFFYKAADTEMMLVHSGTKLYKVIGKTKTLLYDGLNPMKSSAFVFNNLWFFKDGKNYLQYDGKTIKKVEGYVPTTSIGRKPSGGGTIYQDVNILSDYRINTFVADGKSTEFFLDAQNIDTDYKPTVTVNGSEVTVSSVDYAKGKVTLSSAPTAPSTDGQDNVSIKFKKAVDKTKITKCTMLELFDNRVFFSGNPDYPNMIWHCSLNDPTYCSDLDYYNEGLDTANIKGMVAGNNNLWVFKEPSQANTTIFYHTPTTDADYGKIYPNTHSSISTGCIGKAINFNDDIVFFSDRGMEGISGDITTEQVISHRSSLIDRKLLAEKNYADMILTEWEGYLLVIIGNKVYLADSRAVFTNGDHFEYEWYQWRFEKDIICAMVNEGTLYLGTDDGVYTLTNRKADVEGWWTTPKDKFGHPQMQKTTNKKSCTVEAQGEEISVYAKTNRDEGYELLDTFHDVEDAFTCRIKKKKFKDIQLKFYSEKWFCLESATLECFVGGYLKNL